MKSFGKITSIVASQTVSSFFYIVLGVGVVMMGLLMMFPVLGPVTQVLLDLTFNEKLPLVPIAVCGFGVVILGEMIFLFGKGGRL